MRIFSVIDCDGILDSVLREHLTLTEAVGHLKKVQKNPNFKSARVFDYDSGECLFKLPEADLAQVKRP